MLTCSARTAEQPRLPPRQPPHPDPAPSVERIGYESLAAAASAGHMVMFAADGTFHVGELNVERLGEFTVPR